jgi:hypothetical protein
MTVLPFCLVDLFTLHGTAAVKNDHHVHRSVRTVYIHLHITCGHNQFQGNRAVAVQKYFVLGETATEIDKGVIVGCDHRIRDSRAAMKQTGRIGHGRTGRCQQNTDKSYCFLFVCPHDFPPFYVFGLWCFFFQDSGISGNHNSKKCKKTC